MVISLSSIAELLGNCQYFLIFCKLVLFPFLHHTFLLLFLDFLFLAQDTSLQQSMFSNHPHPQNLDLWCSLPIIVIIPGIPSLRSASDLFSILLHKAGFLRGSRTVYLVCACLLSMVVVWRLNL